MSSVAFFTFLFCTLAPMWLVLRVELETSFCWRGDGIWYMNYYWGEDFPLAGVECTDTVGTLSTSEAYCNGAANEPYPGYNAKMCTDIFTAKVLSVLATSCSFFSFLLALIISALHLKARHEFRIAVLATTSSALAMVVGFVLYIVMSTSPLFGSGNRKYVDKHHNIGQQHFSGANCVFQTPLHNILTMPFVSVTVKCLFPGPSYATGLSGVIASAMSTGLFAQLAWQVYKTPHGFARA